jgi:cation diffusion facilitator family transporter
LDISASGEIMEASEKTAWFSLLINLLLVAIKVLLVLLSGSLAIKADAIHSLTDVVSATVILIGIKISKRSSRSFPYGLYKVENLVALGTSLLIFLAGYEIVMAALAGSSQIIPAQLPLAVGGISLTILITFLFSRYELKQGIKTGSPSLVADSRHIWTDMLSSVVILISLLGSALGFAVDRYAALVVVLFIGRVAFIILLDAVSVLLDASLAPEYLNRVREIVVADPRVERINELRARNAGRYKFIELDLALRVKALEKGHLVAEEIKQRIKESLENVDHVLIHYEPCRKEHLILGLPLGADRRTISEHFGEAPFFRLVTVRSSDLMVTADTTLSNPFINAEKAKGIKVANWLLESGLDLMIVRQDLAGKGPGFVLGNADCEILVVSESDADAALAAVEKDLARPNLEPAQK